jgi:hypothetical protein
VSRRWSRGGRERSGPGESYEGGRDGGGWGSPNFTTLRSRSVKTSANYVPRNYGNHSSSSSLPASSPLLLPKPCSGSPGAVDVALGMYVLYSSVGTCQSGEMQYSLLPLRSAGLQRNKETTLHPRRAPIAPLDAISGHR